MHFGTIFGLFLALALVDVINCTVCQDPRYAEASHFNDIYLIRESSYASLKVYTCSIMINGEYRLYKDNCTESFITGVKLVYETRKHYKIKINDTVHYSDKVVEDKMDKQLNISITLTEYTAVANLIGNEIKLRSGIICRYNLGKCFDTKEFSEATWDLTAVHEKNTSIRYDRIPVENTTSYLVTLNKSPLIQFAIIDKENTSFALQLMKKENHHHDFIYYWLTNRRDIHVAFQSQNYILLSDVNSPDTLSDRELSLDLEPKDLVYSMIMNTCALQSRLAKINNFNAPIEFSPPKENVLGENFKISIRQSEFNSEYATPENSYLTIADSTANHVLEKYLILIIAISLLLVMYILHNIAVNCFILKNTVSNRRGKSYMWHSVSQGLTIPYIYNTLQREINILKIKFLSSRHVKLDGETSQWDFDDVNENAYERPLSSQYII